MTLKHSHRIYTFLLISAITVLLSLLPRPAYAHGFGERYDLPVPLYLYLFGAAAAIVFSFIIIVLFLKAKSVKYDYPRVNLLRWRIFRLLPSPYLTLPIKVLSVGVFFLVISAGLFGNQRYDLNIAPTLVWVIWWVGLAYVSALIGNVWSVLNPWRIIFEWSEKLYRQLGLGDTLSIQRKYPQEWGYWPAFLLFLIFSWIELVYSDSSSPLRIAQISLMYSIVTLGGMFIFGKNQWLRYGEAFSVTFGLLSKFAPTEIRITSPSTCKECSNLCIDLDNTCLDCIDCFRHAPREKRELNLRPFAVGLLRNEFVSPSKTIFVVLLLSTVAFDGLTATPVWGKLFNTMFSFLENVTLIGTLCLISLPVLFTMLYATTCSFMKNLAAIRMPVMGICQKFIYSLIPIALAYHLAHFLSYLLIQGQRIIPIASDPFGLGWDLFSTAGFSINIAIVNAKFAWITAVIAIVLGHMIAVYLAHFIAIRLLRNQQRALNSQYPMLVLMIAYTVTSLWIIAQPIVEHPTG